MNLFLEAVGFGTVTAAILALGAVGLTLQFGVTNYANFAFGDYMTLGVYLVWVLSAVLHLALWLAVVIGVLAVALIAVLISEFVLWPFVRRGSTPLIMLIITFGVALIVNNSILAIWGADSQSLPLNATNGAIHLGPFIFTSAQLLIVVLSVVVMFAVHLVLTRTRLGKAMRAVADNSDLARVTGIPPSPITRFTWGLTGALATLSGVALAASTGSFTPSLGEGFLFVLFAVVILGGVGKPYGAMLAAVIVGLVTEVSALVVPQYKLDVAFVVLILVLLLRPEGLIRSPGRA